MHEVIPEHCPFCEASYKGGSALPGDPLTSKRVFFVCGASMSRKTCDKDLKEFFEFDTDTYVLAKNCTYMKDRAFIGIKDNKWFDVKASEKAFNEFLVSKEVKEIAG